jgi:hypothetical protein
MRIIVRSVLLFLCLGVGIAFAEVPPVTVTISTSGKAAFKGNSDAKGTFATGKLQAGNYVVQFNSNNPALKGQKYTIVVAAGKKKVSADVAGEKFARGGVAMKVDVAAGLNISGQVVAQNAPLSKSGKKMVWIRPQLGSHMPGHWAEEGSAEAIAAKNAGTLRTDDVRKIQDKMSNPGGN